MGQRIRGAFAEHPDAVAIGLYALLAIVATGAAYLAIFSYFAAYDDEGTLLVTVKAFAQGDTLYRDVYSAYGPFYYELFGGLFSLTGHAVTTDAGRTIVIVLWVATSFMFGFAAHRLTGRLVLGLTGMIAAFAALGVLTNEPMHPHGLSVALLGAFVLVAVGESDRRAGWAGAGCGALVAALALTKVNLGAFLVAATVVAAVCTVEPLYRRRWLRFPAFAAFLALPLLILARDLSLGWVRELLVLEVLCMAAILTAAHSLRPQRGDEEARLTNWLWASLAGFAAAFVAILGIILLTGPSPADVYDGMITQAVRIRDLLVLPFAFPQAALDWAIGAVVAAALAVRLRSGHGVPTLWSGLLRGAAGLAILCNVAHVVPFGLNPAAGNPDTVPLVLAWVAAVPLPGPRESSHKRFLRVLLPALAVAEALQVYPVAGSQTGIASVAFVPVGALCLGDALSELRAWAATRPASTANRLQAVAGVVTIAFAAILALDAIALPAANSAFAYRNQPELRLPGATLMHLPAPEVETYTRLVDLLHRNRCSTFVAYPSINSLYLWSELEAPMPQLPNAWPKAFDGSQQQRVVDQFRHSRRPCAIRSEELVAGYLHGAAPPDLPLARYVLDEFRLVAQVDSFEFLLPKPSATAP